MIFSFFDEKEIKLQAAVGMPWGLQIFFVCILKGQILCVVECQNLSVMQGCQNL